MEFNRPPHGYNTMINKQIYHCERKKVDEQKMDIYVYCTIL